MSNNKIERLKEAKENIWGFTSISCKYEPEKDLWKCDLGVTQREFASISLKGGREVYIPPSTGNATLRTRDTYCGMVKERGNNLLCDPNKERLERDIEHLIYAGIKGIEPKWWKD